MALAKHGSRKLPIKIQEKKRKRKKRKLPINETLFAPIALMSACIYCHTKKNPTKFHFLTVRAPASNIIV